MTYHQRFKFLEERFWEKVSFGFGNDACYTWKANTRNGYGRFWNGKNFASAHRVSWELAYKPIPKGLYVLHKCDNPSCVKPSHLFLGTYSDNMQDMWDKSRHSIINMGRPSDTMVGESNVNVSLSEGDVLLIREMYEDGLSFDDIHAVYDEVQKPAIWKIVHRKTWKHL